MVFCDEAGYLAAVGRASQVYMPLSDWDIVPLMSDEQRKSVNVILVRHVWVKSDLMRELGGEWKATGQELVPNGHIFMEGKVGLGFLSIPDNHLNVLRRQ